jgi:hypothetical protein
MDLATLTELQRELSCDDGPEPAWLGPVPIEPVCVPTCPHHQRLRKGRCGHTGDEFVHHCPPAVRALGLRIVYGRRADHEPL